MFDRYAITMMTVKNRIAEKLGEKVKGIDGYVVAIVLGVVAIVAGGVFKAQISTFVSNFFSQFSTKAAGLF